MRRGAVVAIVAVIVISVGSTHRGHGGGVDAAKHVHRAAQVSGGVQPAAGREGAICIAVRPLDMYLCRAAALLVRRCKLVCRKCAPHCRCRIWWGGREHRVAGWRVCQWLVGRRQPRLHVWPAWSCVGSGGSSGPGAGDDGHCYCCCRHNYRGYCCHAIVVTVVVVAAAGQATGSNLRRGLRRRCTAVRRCRHRTRHHRRRVVPAAIPSRWPRVGTGRYRLPLGGWWW